MHAFTMIRHRRHAQRCWLLLSVAVFFTARAHAQNLDIWCVWQTDGIGTCSVVRGPDGTVVLLDECGGNTQAEALVTDILAPNGINYIDYAIAGHYDQDHTGGLDDIVGLMGGISAFGAFYDRGGTLRHEGDSIPSGYYDVVTASGRRATPSLDGTSDIDLGNGARLYFLCVGAPDTREELYIRGRPSVTSSITENNKSIAVLVTYGGFDFYFGSDLEGTGEMAVDDVVAADLGRKVDILHVDHHGADTNDISSYSFLHTVDPEIAIISCWDSQPHGHPRRTTVEQLQDVVEPLPQRIIRLEAGDDDHAAWAPGNMEYCLTTYRHVRISTNGTTYTVDTVDRAGGTDITDPGLVNHYADQGSHIPTATPVPVIPTPTPFPEMLSVTPQKDTYRPGDKFIMTVAFKRADVDWDGYLVIIGRPGVYSVTKYGLAPGVHPFIENALERVIPFSTRAALFTVPYGVRGKYTLIAAILPAGSEPTMTSARGLFSQFAVTGFEVGE